MTLFTDLCLVAPAALIGRQRMQLETAGPLAARVLFTHRGKTIGTLLSFNQAGN